MTVTVNKSEWSRDIVISLSADHMTAWHVREFVKLLDAENISDGTEITDSHANDTRRLVGLRARRKEVRYEECNLALGCHNPNHYAGCPDGVVK